MSSIYYINASNSISTMADNTSGKELTAEDTLIVAKDGYILSLGSNGTGVFVGGSAVGAEVAVDGLVIGGTQGVYVLGQSGQVNVYGRVEGGSYGVNLGGNNNQLTIGHDGVVQGGTAVELGAFSNRVVNEGSIIATNGTAVDVAGGGQTIINTGSILSDDRAFELRGTSIKLDNSGYIHGDLISEAASTAYVSLVNSGEWQGDLTLSNYADVVENTGHLFGGDLHLGAGTDQLTNTGRIDGIIDLGDDADLYNGLHGVGSAEVLGGYGADNLYGGDATDALFGQDDNDLLRGGGGDDELHGGTGNDKLNGGDGDDLVGGDEGYDLLKGGRGDDTLGGGLANDTIVGGAGDDLMAGDKGVDTFQFRGDFGHDVILDFEATGKNHDLLSFSHHLFASFADVQAHMAQAGSDVVIHAGDSDVVLQGVTLGALTAADFGFIA